MTRPSLSQEQQRIVHCGDGAWLVLASAGSGKTRVLTERVRYLLEQKEDRHFSVLCLTSTNKAANEMRERLEGVPKLKERAYLGTFHEFCLNKILRAKHHLLGLPVLPHLFDENDQKKVLEEVLALDTDYLMRDAKGKSARLVEVQNRISQWKQHFFQPIEKDPKILSYISDYDTLMQNQHAMDYDDILLYANRVLYEFPAEARLYSRLYRYVMVDEAQDMNALQYELVKKICQQENHGNLMLVGDPKQAIYGFNGGDTKYMEKVFKEDFPVETLALKMNYRSSQAVLKMANHIRPNGPLPKSYFHGYAEVRAFQYENQEAEWVLGKIKDFEKNGGYEETVEEDAKRREERVPIGLKDIAVLVRNRYVLNTLMDLLENDDNLKGRFYVRRGTAHFKPESDLIKVFDLGLYLLTNPMDKLHLRELCRMLRVDSHTDHLEQGSLPDVLLSLAVLPGNIEPYKGRLLEAWQFIRENPTRLDLALVKLEGIQFTEAADAIEKQVQGDLHELRLLWRRYLLSSSAGSHSLSGFRYFLALNGNESPTDGLTLATIHTVKGLEFEIVFVMGVNEGVLPDFRAKTDKAIEEERNNAYVAISRAKKQVYLTYPLWRDTSFGRRGQAPSRFLNDWPHSGDTTARLT